MRRIGRLLTAPALAALALLILPAPAARAQATPYSAEPRTAAAAPGAAKATVTGLTVGRHPGFDRVVLTFEGAVPGWSVRYADSITEDGSDAPVRLDGDATLELAVSPAGAARPDGGPALTATRRRPGFPALKEVRLAGDFEGRVSFGAGVAGRRPFRVLELTGPSRLVLDIAHDARAGTPARLAVTPGSGPSGTTLTVSGTGCNLPGEPVLLVLRGGEDATQGAIQLGTAHPDDRGRFRTTVTVPERLDPIRAEGGGPARPGRYAITTLPSRCSGAFDLTAAPAGRDRAGTAQVIAPVTRAGRDGPGTRDALQLALLVAASAGLAGSGITILTGGRRR